MSANLQAEQKKKKAQAAKKKAAERVKAEAAAALAAKAEAAAAAGEVFEGEDVRNATDIRNPDVVTKYKLAGDIANAALKAVVDACEAGKSVIELCEIGDTHMKEATSKLYNKKVKGKGTEKGVGFPTCISVNHTVGHYSPLSGEDQVLAAGDLVKVDLGCHLDGYLSVAAHSFVLEEEKVEGRKADVCMAAHIASELALRLLKPGNKSTDLSNMLEAVAKDFKCNQVGGIVSHSMTQFVIDGEKVIVNKPEKPDQKSEEVEFEPNEVYAIDIVMSTGEGKAGESEQRCTVYKRSVEEVYKLKMKASRVLFTEIKDKYPTFPFTIRDLDQKVARFGIRECRDHELVSAYPVLQEKAGELVAHVKFTALVTANGTMRVAGFPIDPSKLFSENSLSSDAHKALLLTSAGKKKKKKKKNKKKKA